MYDTKVAQHCAGYDLDAKSGTILGNLPLLSEGAMKVTIGSHHGDTTLE